MLKVAIRQICEPFALRRYGSIFGIKNKINNSKGRCRILRSIYGHYLYKRGSFIGLGAVFLGEPIFPHGPVGVFISENAVIGRNAVIFQQVTIGSDTLADSPDQGSPQIGDNAYIGAGAKIIGGVKIGNNCRIGANAVVYTDMGDNCVAVCQPTRIIQKEKLDNRFLRPGEKGATKE